jgi:hypothetical protein
MKKIFLTLSIFITVLTSITFISSAKADDQVATYAVLNENNEVTNTIVCSAAVCGGGTLGADRVVLQLPNNPAGGQYGYLSAPGQPPVTYDPQTQTFTVPQGSSKNSQEIITTNNDGIKVTDKLNVSVGATVSTFKAPNSVSDNMPVLTVPKAMSGSQAKLSVTEINGAKCVLVNGQSLCETLSQSLNFTVPQTAQQILNTVIQNKLDLIQKNIDILLSLIVKGAVVK